MAAFAKLPPSTPPTRSASTTRWTRRTWRSGTPCGPGRRTACCRMSPGGSRRGSCRTSGSSPVSWAASEPSGCPSRGMGARVLPLCSTGSPAWNWRPPTPGFAPLSPYRGPSPCTPSTPLAARSRSSAGCRTWPPARSSAARAHRARPRCRPRRHAYVRQARRQRRRLGAQRAEDVDHQRVRRWCRRRVGADRRRDPRVRRAHRHPWVLRARDQAQVVAARLRHQ